MAPTAKPVPESSTGQPSVSHAVLSNICRLLLLSLDCHLVFVCLARGRFDCPCARAGSHPQLMFRTDAPIFWGFPHRCRIMIPITFHRLDKLGKLSPASGSYTRAPSAACACMQPDITESTYRCIPDAALPSSASMPSLTGSLMICALNSYLNAATAAASVFQSGQTLDFSC